MSPSLLLVDDERSILFAFKEYFSDCGFEVHAAASLAEAQRSLEARVFDAAIVDLRLSRAEPPEGRLLVEQLRQRWPRTRVVVLTAYGSPPMVEEMEALGVDALLSKPYPLSKIACLLERMLPKAGSREKEEEHP